MGEAIGNRNESGDDRAVFVFGKPLFVPREVLGSPVLSIKVAAEELGVTLGPQNPQLTLLDQVPPTPDRSTQELIQDYIAYKANYRQQG